MTPDTTPYVTVIIGAYNSMPYITQTLQSVYDQTIGRDRIELLTVDDRSTDGTYEELLRYQKEVWPEMRVDRLDQNSGGPSAPRNRALEYAQGKWLFFLDADDWLGDEALERMTACGEENDTEIIMGRMGSAGGRTIPVSMYKKSVGRADLYNSRVYWTLNVMKLFKHDLFKRTGLLFPEDILYSEDQPAITRAYLEARGISVLADYDYVYWRKRDDGGNLTARLPIAKYLKTFDKTFGVLTEYLEPGEKRDWLMRRHFHIGLIQITRQLAIDAPGNDEIRDEANARMQEWTREYYNKDIGLWLNPVHRLTYELLILGEFDRLAEVYEWEAAQSHKGPFFIDDGVVYERWPFFRDPEIGLPDYCYDATKFTKARYRMDRAEWNGGVLEIAGHALMHRIPDAEITIELVVRLRDKSAEEPLEHVVATQPSAIHDAGPDDIDTERDTADHSGSGFSVSLDVTTLAEGAPLDTGLWDLYLRISSAGLVREMRLGSKRDDAIDTTEVPRFVGTGDDARVVTTYYTDPYGNLTLDVGENKHEVLLAMELPPQWDAEQRATVRAVGNINAVDVPSDGVFVRLTGPHGAVFEMPATLDELETATRVTCRVPLKSAADGKALPNGTWKVTTHLDAAGVKRTAKIPDLEPLPTIRWWRGLRPMHARSLAKPNKSLRLRITPVNLKHAVKRRLGL